MALKSETEFSILKCHCISRYVKTMSKVQEDKTYCPVCFIDYTVGEHKCEPSKPKNYCTECKTLYTVDKKQPHICAIDCKLKK